MATHYIDGEILQKANIDIVPHLDYREVSKDINLINYILTNVLKTDEDRKRFLVMLVSHYNSYYINLPTKISFESFKTVFDYFVKFKIKMNPDIAYRLFTFVEDFFKKVDKDKYYKFIENCFEEKHIEHEAFYKLVSNLRLSQLEELIPKYGDKDIKYQFPLNRNHACVGFVQAVQRRDIFHLRNIKRFGYNLDGLLEDTKYALYPTDIEFYNFIKEMI